MESRYHNLGTENEKGSGLGLKLVKSMIDHIGSEITVTSVEGEGSEFCFSLKLSR
jgi:signal transduction histidine kinase